MIDILRAFWDGFTRPRPVALAGIFLVALVPAALLTPPFLARLDARYLMAGPHDYGGMLTSVAMRLRETPVDGTLTVVHAGSSFSQEALDDPDAVGEQLSRALGRPVRYWPLFLPDPSIAEEGALIDLAPAGVTGFAVIEITPTLIARTVDGPKRFARRNEMVVDAPRTGVPVLDHPGFFAARRENLWKWILGRPAAWGAIHRYEDETERPARAGHPLEDLARNFDRQAPVNLAALERVVEKVEARGLKVILLKATPRPSSVADFPAMLRAYHRQVDDFCRRLDLICLEPAVAAGVTDDDYFDRYHLWKQPARRRFQAAFVRAVALHAS